MSDPLSRGMPSDRAPAGHPESPPAADEAFDGAKRDIRASRPFREALALSERLRGPGSNRFADAAEPNASPDGASVVFCGLTSERADTLPASRLCELDIATGDIRTLVFDQRAVRSPLYAPDGRTIAFLSAPDGSTDFQLRLLDRATGVVRCPDPVDGWAEYLRWSPDGSRIMLGVAAHGADVSGPQGAVTTGQGRDAAASWMPEIDGQDDAHRWRRLWVCDVASGRSVALERPAGNPWEAAWCGSTSLVAVVSDRPEEGAWYGSRLVAIDLATGAAEELFVPARQIGWPCASPDGGHVAIVEAIASDRGVVAGDLVLIERKTGAVRIADTAGVDVTYAEWRSADTLLVAGHRGFETVLGLLDVPSGVFREIWADTAVTVSGRYASATGIGADGDCVFIAEGFRTAPEIGILEDGRYRALRSFDIGYVSACDVLGEVAEVAWAACDGETIQGYLLKPATSAPHPVVLFIHGGPVWHWRPTCLMRNLPALLLLQQGYAIFLPNPRGSSGRGQRFACGVLGDMGGADAGDLLAGLDHLVAAGYADPARLGLTGVSYGGFMSAWLVTQDKRFAAAVSVAPTTNQVSQHLICNIPEFVELFAGGTYWDTEGGYYRSSPVLHARHAITPTLMIAGRLDRCTPPEEAVQFHNALRQAGTESQLVIYPEEGHGVRSLPAAFDYAARLVGWFERHMPAGADAAGTRS